MITSRWVQATSLAIICGMVAGCGGGTAKTTTGPVKEADTKPRDPVELIMVPFFLTMSDQEFDDYMVKPVKAKYPHITLKLDRTAPDKLAIAGTFPDLFYTANSRFTTFSDLDIPYDMSELIKANKVDMNVFSKPNIDWVKELGSKGEIYGLPFDLNHMGMFYNKDIFDKRGVPYPKDGLTWDDVVELNKKLTFADGGVQYRGIVPMNVEGMIRTRSIAMVDAKNKAIVDTPQMKAVLELQKSFHSIPGMIVNNEYPMAKTNFTKDQTVAMYVNWITDVASSMMSDKIQMNFDLVGAPSFKDLPMTTIDPGAKMIGISKTSKYKEDAFKAIQVLTSPEVQRNITRKGRLTVLADESIRKEFGIDLEILKGKNIQGAMAVKAAKMAPPNLYAPIVAGKVNGVMKDLVLGTKDINTLLRETQEASDKAIEEELAKKKK